MPLLFITGIDTDIGKTVATGAIAKSLIATGKHVMTQKLVETGCGINQSGRFSKDLTTHEKIIGKTVNTEGSELHSPYLFKYPASPHLSAELENQVINLDTLKSTILKLSKQCDYLLIEGAGGLCVPLNNSQTVASLINDLNIPISLVTSPRLGSINHTLLSIEFCHQNNIKIHSLIYNTFSHSETDSDNKLIENNTRQFLQKAIQDISKQNKTSIAWYELDAQATLQSSNPFIW